MRIILSLILFITTTISAQPTSQSYITAKSKGRLPMLAYGLGQDRLGGAKMGYIDTGVILRIIDSTKDMYLVQLSKSHTEYISKNDVALDTSVKRKPFYLTNSWRVRGDDLYDYVSISVDEKLPYKSWMEINPSKIILEIYGVQSNTNWITQLRSVREVKNVSYDQVEDDVVRITIELKHKQHWGYTVNYKGKNLTVRIRRQPANLYK